MPVTAHGYEDYQLKDCSVWCVLPLIRDWVYETVHRCRISPFDSQLHAAWWKTNLWSCDWAPSTVSLLAKGSSGFGIFLPSLFIDIRQRFACVGRVSSVDPSVYRRRKELVCYWLERRRGTARKNLHSWKHALYGADHCACTARFTHAQNDDFQRRKRGHERNALVLSSCHASWQATRETATEAGMLLVAKEEGTDEEEEKEEVRKETLVAVGDARSRIHSEQ